MSELEVKTVVLRDVLESFRRIHTEIVLEFFSRNIFISARNQPHSVFIKARIDTLKNYSMSECRKLVFDLTNLREFLEVYPEEFTELKIAKDAIYVGKEKNFLFYVFSEDEFFEIPEIDVLYECDLEKNDLVQIFKELRVFSCFFKLEASDDNLRFSGEDKIKGKGKVMLRIPKIDEEFEGIFSLHPLLDILDDSKIESTIKFKIFKNNVIGFFFKKYEIVFEIYIVEHIGEEI